MKASWAQMGVNFDRGPSIDELTTACQMCRTWSRDDRLRLGYLAIYAGFIEAARTSSPTRASLTRLVMDLDAFEDYPWGRVAFKFLMESVKGVDLTKTYAIEGFVPVLQVWVYCCLPEFGAGFGHPIEGSPTPPLLSFLGGKGKGRLQENMLKHTRTKNFTMKDYSEMFPRWDGELEDEKADNIVKAVFSSGWAWEQSHWPLVGTKLWTNVKVEIHPMKTEAGQMMQSLKAVPPSRTQSDAESSKKAHKAKKDSAEESKGDESDESKGEESKGEESRAEESRAEESKAAETAPKGMTTRAKARDTQATVACCNSAERQRRLAATQQSPFDGNSTAKVIIPNQPKQGQGYNPFANFDRQKLSALLDWVKLDPKWRQKVKGSSSHWFYILLTPTKWLIDTHMDAGINLLRLRYTKHPEWFRSDRFCILDAVFTQMWTAKYSEFLASPANPDGSERSLGSLRISIPRRRIVIWDSDLAYATDAEIAKAVKPIAHMLPYMLRMLSTGAERELYTVDFTHERESGVPQNKQSGDCGVYCLTYIECHALGMPFPPQELCDKKIKTIRS
uniref:Ubiquitin-like protease family profile domain-containing protein n=1 Tax=Brassica oleracea var. oleracea TaxID=109376 RepID=A0A0D3CHE8_BRAOL